jgi:predicted phage baseplate assembly protein
LEGDLRLVRDRERRVVEVWVRWQGRRHLYGSGESDRHYLIERARGRLQFGDGVRGRIPPDGAAIVARVYRSGGGRRGNVAARTITQAAASLGGVEELFNPVPAGGGAESETLLDVALRGARTLRHRSRAVCAADYETMALEASSAVAVARALALRDPAGRRRAGWMTLQIIPESTEPRPWPTFQLREQVRRYICDHAGPQAATGHLHVTGPTYHAVDVRAAIALRPAHDAALVEEATRAAIAGFLDPLRGGPAGEGWKIGRDVYLSDLAAVVERVEGVDYVEELSLMSETLPVGERLRVPEGRVVAAGDILVVVRG